MRPTHLKLSNFGLFRGIHSVSLDGVRFACVTGLNASGKTTLVVDSILYALAGETRAGLENIVSWNEQIGSVELTCAVREDRYLISRQRSRKGAGKSTLVLMSLDADGNPRVAADGQPIQWSGAAAQAQIERVTGMTAGLLRSTAFAVQDDLGRFSDAKPAERKGVFGEILNLGQWERRAEATRAMSRDLSGWVESHARAVATLTDEAATGDGLRLEMEACKIAADGLEMRVRSLAQDLDALNTEREGLVRMQAEDAGRRRELEELGTRLEALRPELATARERLAQLQLTAGEWEQIAEQITAAEAAGKSAEQMEGARTERERLTAELATLKAQYDAAIAQHQAAVADLAGRVRQAQDAEKVRVSAVRQEYQAILSEQTQALQQQDAAEDRLSSEILRLKEAEESRVGFVQQVLAQARKQAALLDTVECQKECHHCGHDSPEGHLIASHFPAECSLLTQALAAKARIPELEAALVPASPVPWAHKEAELATLETRDIAAEFGPRLEPISARIPTPEPVPWAKDEAQFKGFSETKPGTDLLEKATGVRSQRDGLHYDEAQHHQAKTDAATLGFWQRKLATAEEAEKQIESATEAVVSKGREVCTVTERAAALEAEVGPARDFAAELTALTKKQTGLAEESKGAHARLEDLHKQHGQLVAQYEAAKAAGELAKELEAERVALTRRVMLLNMLGNPRDGAFSKSGIPAHLIDEALPAFEEAANEILRTLTDGEVSVELRTQHQGDSGVTETLEIVCQDSYGDHPFECFSGGQKVRVNLALRVGLSRLLTQRSGADWRFLVIDEPPYLDDPGQDELIAALGRLTAFFDTILLITHETRLKDSVACCLQVTKDADGSHVEMIAR